MASKNKKKVTCEQILKSKSAVKYNELKTIVYDSDLCINVKQSLTLDERIRIVAEAAEVVFSEDTDGNITYSPSLRDFSISERILRYFTDIELSEDVKEIYKLVAETSIVQDVIETVGRDYIEGIVKDVNALIEFKKSQILKYSSLNKLLDTLSGLIKSLQDETGHIDLEGIIKLLKEQYPDLSSSIDKMIKESEPKAEKPKRKNSGSSTKAR